MALGLTLSPSTPWKFSVSGVLVRSGSGDVVYPAEAILESGEREEASPYSLDRVGPLARTSTDGAFHGVFYTKGLGYSISCPANVSVFLRVARGVWKPYVVEAKASNCQFITASELVINLGLVVIEKEQVVFSGET